MSEPTGETSVRSLINLVKTSAIKSLVMERASRILDDERSEELRQIIRGVVTEVAYVVGDPPPPEKAERAAWCVALGVAAALEFSLNPNQQLNGESRGAALQAKYLAVKAELRGAAIAGSTTTAARFSYPPPPAWPDQRRW